MQQSKVFMAAVCTFAIIGASAHAQSANPFAGIPGGSAISRVPVVGGFFGGGKPPSTEQYQILQQAEAVLQTKAQLEALLGFDLNNAQSLAHAVYTAQELLGQLDGVLSYDPAAIVGEVEERYPLEEGPLSGDDLLERARLARIHNRNAIAESHRLQAQLSSAVAGSAERDAELLDSSAAAPGVRAAIMAGNQLAASTAAELRQLGLVMAANARATETETLERVSAQEQADAYKCFISEGTSPVCRK